MTLGLDIHPVYQNPINWGSLDKNVKYIWLKVSDGGAAYRKVVDGITYTPDSHAAGMKAAGVASGGYHYAQFDPTPERQAEVFHQEVKRLGLNTLAPALDLEAPFIANNTAKDFSIRFLTKLKSYGWSKVAIYSYTSMMQYLKPESWNIPGLIIWVARPGPVGDMGSYTGRADVHQYTSTGTIQGVQDHVDCNQTLNNNLLGNPHAVVDTTSKKRYYLNQH